LVEQRTLNPLVEGSNPSGSTKKNKIKKIEQEAMPLGYIFLTLFVKFTIRHYTKQFIIMDIFTPKFSHHEDEMVMINSLKTSLYNIAEDAIYSTGTCRIAVAGGNTPKLLYRELSKLTLDWQNIEIYQVDERFTDINSVDSNQKMIREQFSEAIDKGAEFYPIKIKETIEATVEAYNTEISLLDSPLFDLVILGVGLDGHFASLFPDENYLKGDTDYVIHTTTDNYTITDRISLSVASVLNSKFIYVYITGEEKYSIIEETFHGQQKAVNYPVKVLFAHPEVVFFYCADEMDL
jgi:6-phosphogluconolactonase